MGKHTPKILIVEDNINNHLLYRDAFEKAGFNVVFTQNADGSFATAVHQLAPDIISMDLMIGKNGAVVERDGFGAIELLKADPRTRNIPIIVLTNFSAEDKAEHAKELGAIDFISLAGQTITKIPEHFLRCVTQGKHYKASHALFRNN